MRLCLGQVLVCLRIHIQIAANTCGYSLLRHLADSIEAIESESDGSESEPEMELSTLPNICVVHALQS